MKKVLFFAAVAAISASFAACSGSKTEAEAPAQDSVVVEAPVVETVVDSVATDSVAVEAPAQ